VKTIPLLIAAFVLTTGPSHAGKPAAGEFVREDFSKPDATAAWRWGAGKWTVADGALRGTETAERKHPAGIACPRAYHDAVIDFRFRFDGGKLAMLLLRDRFGNLCRLTLNPSGAVLTKDKPNLPKDTPEKTVALAAAKLKLAPDEWHTVRATVRGPHFHVVLDGRTTLEGRHPGIDVAKTEIEFLAGGDSVLFDDLVARHLDTTTP
jgi:hypothetical protein